MDKDNRVTSVNLCERFPLHEKLQCIYACLLLQELVMDLLQSVVEIVMYGDRQDPHIFEYGSVCSCFLDDVFIIVMD